jgi:hypothetical protein
MFSMFALGLFHGIIILVTIQLSKLVFSYIKANGIDEWVGLLVVVILLTLSTSCTKDEITQDLCGDCQVRFEIPFEQDANGYYHAKLSFNSAGAARFNIDAYASTIADKDLWENDTPNFYSIFSGNIELTNDVGVVQHSRLQHDKSGFTRRTVGPVLTDHIGDTLVVSVDTHWVYAPLWENTKNTLKIIIE